MAEPIFKHTNPQERFIAEEFIKRFCQEARVTFDVPLVSRKPAKWEEMPENYKIMWQYLTAKKIDFIAEFSDRIWIVEVKDKLSAAGIGQLLLYKKMFVEQYKPGKPIELWLIAIYPDLDVIDLCNDLGIKWWVLNASLI